MQRTAIAVLLLAGLTAASSANGADAAGTIYKARCASCHGDSFELGSSDIRKVRDEELITVTLDGRGKMPAFRGKLTDEEIRNVVAYIRAVKR